MEITYDALTARVIGKLILKPSSLLFLMLSMSSRCFLWHNAGEKEKKKKVMHSENKVLGLNL